MDVDPQAWQLTEILIDEDDLERVVRAVEKVRDRLQRAARALDEAAIPYAVIGGNAVAVHVGRVDESAVRNTPGVEILLRRPDLEVASIALAKQGFVYRNANGTDLFLDDPTAHARTAVRIFSAGERLRSRDLRSAVDVSESEPVGSLQVLALEPLVSMLLASFRAEDRMHVRDLIDIGLVDETWLPHLPVELAERLQVLLDDPQG
jgi:hypothetical protein